jgi:rare lipoprotein A
MKSLHCWLLLICLAQMAPAFTQRTAHRDKKKNPETIQYGTASYYANKFQGRKTAMGELYDKDKMTCAHNSLPLGTWIKVTNLRNNRTVIVRITDRLHYKNKRLVDLSRAAAAKLGYLKRGLTRVKIEVLGKKPPTDEQNSR